MTKLAGRPVTIVGEGRCATCGVSCLRFVCDGQVGTFHSDPVCAPFLDHAQAHQHVERAVFHAESREFRADKHGVN